MPPGIDIPRMVTGLIASRSTAMLSALRTRMSLNGFLPFTFEYLSSSLCWSIAMKMVRFSSPSSTLSFGSLRRRSTSCTGRSVTRSTSPERSAAPRVAAGVLGPSVRGEERRHARGVGLDRAVDDVGDVALDLLPPALVEREDDLLVGLPGLDHVGPGAVGVARGVGLLLLRVVLHVLRAVLLRPGLAHDAEVDEVAEQHRVRTAEDEVDGVVVDFLHFLDAGDVHLHRSLRLHDAAEREHDVVRGEGRAVVELDALPQIEAPLRVGDLLPARREAGLDAEGLGVAREAFVGVLQDRVGGGVVLRVRVERQDVVLRRPAQLRRIYL